MSLNPATQQGNQQVTQQIRPQSDHHLKRESQTFFLIPTPPSTQPSIPLGDFLSIGRDAQNQLQIKDAFASGRHARIERKGAHFILRDLRSRNGTFVNGARICECFLSPDDRISFGTSEYVFSPSEKLQIHNEALQSKSLKWNQQLTQIPSFAKTDFPVLILGPSGTGKEILASAVHELSERAGGPFISVNCSALSESLVESELFGHVKGSFTGATHDRKGAFEAARGGTLFLDEIGDLPLSLQPKLLRALENSEVRPVGSDRIVKTNVRIIAATHQKLHQKVQQGEFRTDLYFRLNVIKLTTPPLIERMEDFDSLVYEFARQMRVRFSHNAIEKLKEHNWPGNIRELKNVVARAAACMPGQHIQPEHLPLLIDQLMPLQPVDPDNSLQNGPLIKEIEREMIRKRLVANNGNQRRTAADLGIPKSTLHDRIRTYHIDVDELLRG